MPHARSHARDPTADARPIVITLRQHRPAFVDSGDPIQTITVADLAALVAIPWVRRFREDPQFTRYSLADGTILMAEYANGEYWVVGFLTTDAPIDLQTWAAPTREETH